MCSSTRKYETKRSIKYFRVCVCVLQARLPWDGMGVAQQFFFKLHCMWRSAAILFCGAKGDPKGGAGSNLLIGSD